MNHKNELLLKMINMGMSHFCITRTWPEINFFRSFRRVLGGQGKYIVVGFGKILHCMELIGRLVMAVRYHLYHAIEAVYYAMLWRQYMLLGGDIVVTDGRLPPAQSAQLQKH